MLAKSYYILCLVCGFVRDVRYQLASIQYSLELGSCSNLVRQNACRCDVYPSPSQLATHIRGICMTRLGISTVWSGSFRVWSSHMVHEGHLVSWISWLELYASMGYLASKCRAQRPKLCRGVYSSHLACRARTTS
jgi:hypothetical protein